MEGVSPFSPRSFAWLQGRSVGSDLLATVEHHVHRRLPVQLVFPQPAKPMLREPNGIPYGMVSNPAVSHWRRAQRLETDDADYIRWEQRVWAHLEHGQDVEQARQVVGELGERLLDQHQSVAPAHTRESEQINEASADRIGVARIAEAERADMIA